MIPRYTQPGPKQSDPFSRKLEERTPGPHGINDTAEPLVQKGGPSRSRLDDIPGTKIAWKLDGHGFMTRETARRFERSLRFDEPRYVDLLRIDFDVQFRDIEDIYTFGHWKSSGQKHHFMRVGGQSELKAYEEGVSWIVQESKKAAEILQPRLECISNAGIKIRSERQWSARKLLSCMRTGEVELHLGNALHALQDSFSPAHVDRETGSLVITRIHVYDKENKDPSTPGKVGHSELDKSWKNPNGSLTESGEAAVDASLILLRCIVTAAISFNPAKTLPLSLKEYLIERYLKHRLPKT